MRIDLHTRERDVVHRRNRLCDFAGESPKSLPVLAAIDIASWVKWLKPLGITEATSCEPALYFVQYMEFLHFREGG